MTADFEGQRIGEEVILVFRRHILTSVKGFCFFVLFATLGGGLIYLLRDVLAIQLYIVAF